MEGSGRVSENSSSSSTWLYVARARARSLARVPRHVCERGNDSVKREDVGSRLRRESFLYFEKGEILARVAGPT